MTIAIYEQPPSLLSLEECRSEILGLERELERTTKEIRQRQGEILLEVKARLPHGEFTTFLESVGWNPRTARHYMQAVKEPKEVKQIAQAEAETKSASFAVFEAEVVEEEEPESFVVVEPIAEQEPIIERLTAEQVVEQVFNPKPESIDREQSLRGLIDAAISLVDKVGVMDFEEGVARQHFWSLKFAVRQYRLGGDS